MVKKNMTIDDLAIIINTSFEGQKEFFNKKLEGIESDLNFIKTKIIEVVPAVQKLEHRVDYIENTLNIKK